jgi:RNase P subunit RPR2
MSQSRKEIEVWAACNELFSEGMALTYKNIWDKLEFLGYRRGSSTEIKKYLESWRTSRANEFPLQKARSDDLERAIELVREKIREEAEIQIAQTKYTADLIVEEAEAKVKDTLKELVWVQEQLTEARQLKSALEDKLIELEKELANKTELSIRHEERAAYLGKEVNLKNYQLEHLINDLTVKHQQSIETLSCGFKENSNKLQDSYEKRCDTLMLELDKARTRLNQKEQAYFSLQGEYDEARKRFKEREEGWQKLDSNQQKIVEILVGQGEGFNGLAEEVKETLAQAHEFKNEVELNRDLFKEQNHTYQWFKVQLEELFDLSQSIFKKIENYEDTVSLKVKPNKKGREQ